MCQDRPDSMQVLGQAMSSMEDLSAALAASKTQLDFQEHFDCDFEDLDFALVAFREACDAIKDELTPPLEMGIIMALRTCAVATCSLVDRWPTTFSDVVDFSTEKRVRCAAFHQSVHQLAIHVENQTWRTRLEDKLDHLSLLETIEEGQTTVSNDVSRRRSKARIPSRTSIGPKRSPSIVGDMTTFAGSIATPETCSAPPRWHAARGKYDTGADVNLVSKEFLQRNCLVHLIQDIESETYWMVQNQTATFNQKVTLLWQPNDSPSSYQSDFRVESGNAFDILIGKDEWIKHHGRSSKAHIFHHLKLAKVSPAQKLRQKERKEQKERENAELLERRRAEPVRAQEFVNAAPSAALRFDAPHITFFQRQHGPLYVDRAIAWTESPQPIVVTSDASAASLEQAADLASVPTQLLIDGPRNSSPHLVTRTDAQAVTAGFSVFGNAAGASPHSRLAGVWEDAGVSTSDLGQLRHDMSRATVANHDSRVANSRTSRSNLATPTSVLSLSSHTSDEEVVEHRRSSQSSRSDFDTDTHSLSVPPTIAEEAQEAKVSRPQRFVQRGKHLLRRLSRSYSATESSPDCGGSLQNSQAHRHKPGHANFEKPQTPLSDDVPPVFGMEHPETSPDRVRETLARLLPHQVGLVARSRRQDTIRAITPETSPESQCKEG